jgi:hypothetical protein
MRSSLLMKTGRHEFSSHSSVPPARRGSSSSSDMAPRARSALSVSQAWSAEACTGDQAVSVPRRGAPAALAQLRAGAPVPSTRVHTVLTVCTRPRMCAPAGAWSEHSGDGSTAAAATAAAAAAAPDAPAPLDPLWNSSLFFS